MTHDEFLRSVEEMLDTTDTLTPSHVLEDIPTYDSLAVLNMLGLYDSLGAPVRPEDITAAKTVQDFIDLAGGNISHA